MQRVHFCMPVVGTMIRTTGQRIVANSERHFMFVIQLILIVFKLEAR